MKRRGLVALAILAGIALAVGAGTAIAQDAAPKAAAEGPDVLPTPGAAPAASAAPICPDSPAQLVEALGRRSRGLDEREASIKAREKALTDAQTKLDARLADLEAVRAKIGAQLEEADAERTARIASLVTMVESNRPSAIAPMFAALEPELAVAVLDKMNRQKAGKLLAALPPARASLLATRMATPLQLAAPVAAAPVAAAPAPSATP